MRNLVVLTDEKGSLIPLSVSPETDVQLAVDAANGHRYALFADGTLTAVGADGNLMWQATLPPTPVDGLQGCWIYLSYVSELEALLAVHRCGTLLTVPVAACGRVVTPVGDVDGGIEAAALSPDHSTLLLITGEQRLLTMTTHWDVLAEVDADPFIGRCGLPDAPSMAVKAWWRPDGQYFAFSAVDARTMQRSVRIYAQDAARASLGRHEDGSPVSGLHEAGAWCPGGGPLACGQTVAERGARLQVSLFETNGLRHRELVVTGHGTGVSATTTTTSQSKLPATALPVGTQVTWLGWSADGETLGLVLEQQRQPDAVESVRTLQLWSRDNYVWHLKRETRFGEASTPEHPGSVRGTLASVAWDVERPYQLHTLVLRRREGDVERAAPCVAQFNRMDFCWDFTVAPELAFGFSEAAVNAGSTVATIFDGGRIAVSPLSRASVPPPMAFTTLQVLRPALGTTATSATTSNAVPLEVSFSPGWCLHTSTSTVTATSNASSAQSLPRPRVIAAVDLCVRTATGDLVMCGVAFHHPRDAATPQRAPTAAAINAARDLLQLPTESAIVATGLPSDTGSASVAWAASVQLDGASCTLVLPATLSTSKQQSAVISAADALPRTTPARLRSSGLRQISWCASTTSGDSASTTTGGGGVRHRYLVGAATYEGWELVSGTPPMTNTGTGNTADAILVMRVDTPDGVAAASSLETCLLQLTGEQRVIRIAPVHLNAQALQRSASLRVTVALAHLNDGTILDVGLRLHESPAAHTDTTHHLPPLRDTVALAKSGSLPEQCPWVLAVHPTAESERPVVLGLSRAGRLYAGMTMLSPAIAPHGMGWHSRHRLLLAIARGPVPSLMYAVGTDVARAAAGEPVAPFALALSTSTSTSTFTADYAGAAEAGTDAVWQRALERGSRLVCVDGDEDLVTLQLPRGNTETVVPRALTLATVRALLDGRGLNNGRGGGGGFSFGIALELMRAHRVDLNLLVDHDRAAFERSDWLLEAALRGVPQVVAAAARGGRPGVAPVARNSDSGVVNFGADRWDLLLSAISDEDVTEHKYHPPPWYVAPGAAVQATPSRAMIAATAAAIRADPTLSGHMVSTSKINRAVAHVRHALLTAMAMSFPSSSSAVDTAVSSPATATINWRHPLITSVVTSFARQDPADLPSLLRTVRRVAEAEVEASKSTSPNGLNTTSTGSGAPVSADTVLAHAVVVCDGDTELLYAEALGIYDVQLAAALAQRSAASDPREVQPFLGRLKTLAAPRPGDESAPSPRAVDGATPGDLRLRWAVDIHLGRFSRALEALLHLSLHEIARGVGDAAPTDDAIMVALHTPLAIPLLRPDAVVDEGIASPTVMALKLAASRGVALLKRAAAVWTEAASSSTTTSTSGNLFKGHTRRLARASLITAAWRSVAGSTFVPSPHPTAAQAIALPAFSRAITAGRIVDTLLVMFAPAGSADGIAAAASTTVAAALDAFLEVVPPAVDDAVALVAARVAGARGSTEPAYRGTPLPELLQTLASLPQSALRRRRWIAAKQGASTYATAVLGLTADAPAAPSSNIHITRSELQPVESQQLTNGSPPAEASPPVSTPLPPVPTIADLAVDVAGSLSSLGGRDGAAAAGRLLAGVGADIEAAVTALSDGGAWVEAVCAANARRRSDLIDTVVFSSVDAAADACVDALRAAATGILEAAERLEACRAMRAAVPIDELLGRDEAYAALAAAIASGADGVDAADADGGASLWSDATSIVSGATTTASSAASSSASALSSATSGGFFSHLAPTSMPTRLVTARALRLGGVGGNVTSADLVADGAQNAARAVAKRAAVAARAAARGARGGGHYAGRSKPGRMRPGGAAAEAALEAELVALLPLRSGAWTEAERAIAADAAGASDSAASAAPAGVTLNVLRDDAEATGHALLLLGRSATLARLMAAFDGLRAAVPMAAQRLLTRRVRPLAAFAAARGVSVATVASHPSLAALATRERGIDVADVLAAAVALSDDRRGNGAVRGVVEGNSAILHRLAFSAVAPLECKGARASSVA